MDSTIPEPFSLCNLPVAGRRRDNSGFRVPFGQRDGRVWAPAEVASGKACGCVCPGCLAPVVAKALSSRTRRPHFAHLNGAGCQTGYETGIHSRAKQVIEDRLELLLPAWDGDLLEMPNPPTARDDNGQRHEGRRVDVPARRVAITNVEQEVWFGSYRPDVVAIDDVGVLLIEIQVTHAVDARKAERVQAQGRRMVEIDLSDLDRSIPHDPDAFQQAVLFELLNRAWISCPQAVADWQAAKAELDLQMAERNRWLAEQRDAAAMAAKESQQRQAREENGREGRREYMRKLERARHGEDLKVLMELAAPDRIQRLILEYQTNSETCVSNQLEAAPAAVRSACLAAHPDAWIFGVDPALWQLLAFREFVGRQSPGHRFNQREVAAWVRSSFPYEQALYRLFVTQYAKRADARRAGYAKRRLSFWAFSDEENRLIPNFYAPINAFMDRLADAALIRQLPAPLGECEVRALADSGFNPVAAVDAGHLWKREQSGFSPSETPHPRIN